MADALPDKPSDPRVRVLRFLHPDDSTKVIQLELVDTGKTTGDGLSVFAIGTVPTSPIPSSIKKSPYAGLASVAALGTRESLNQFPITNAAIATDLITIAGDWTSFITTGDSITIYGSTGNDGTYTVVSRVYVAGSTVIELETGDITDATADGKVSLAEILIISAVVQAKNTNTDVVALGGQFAAVGIGIQLTAGEFAIIEAGAYPIDLAEQFIDVAVNGEGVTWYILG